MYLWSIIALAAVGALTGCGGGGSHSSGPTSLDAPFAYDASNALGLQTAQTTPVGGVEVRDVSFKGAAGETVPAYLIVPPGKGLSPPSSMPTARVAAAAISCPRPSASRSAVRSRSRST